MVPTVQRKLLIGTERVRRVIISNDYQGKQQKGAVCQNLKEHTQNSINEAQAAHLLLEPRERHFLFYIVHSLLHTLILYRLCSFSWDFKVGGSLYLLMANM